MANTWNDIGIGTLYTTAIPYDATYSSIQSELEDIYGVGEVTVADDADFTITFSVETKDSNLTGDFTLLTGATAPALTITQAYADAPSGTYATFNNQGTLETYVVMEATINEATTEDFTLSLTDETYITIESSTSGFSIDDEVIVDTAMRTVTLNDVDVQNRVTIDSSFFRLPVGAGKVTPDPISTSLTLKFRQRFI